MKHELIGQLLVEKELISREQCEQLLLRQPGANMRFASLCWSEQIVDEPHLLRVLGGQRGLPGVALAGARIATSHLGFVPESFARKMRVLPVWSNDKQLVLVAADPVGDDYLEELNIISARELVVCLGLETIIEQALNQAYAARLRKEAWFSVASSDRSSLSRSLNLTVDLITPDGIPSPKIVSREQGVSDSGLRDAANPTSDLWSQLFTEEQLAERIAIDWQDDILDDDQLILDDESGVSVEPSESESSESGEQRMYQSKVLLVDDDAGFLELLGKQLRHKGLLVYEATRGLDALKKVRLMPPDLMILDAMLPEMHGFEVCRRLKQSERYAHIPIIVVSSVYHGWRIASDLKETYQVDLFLEKPLVFDLLWNHVVRILRRTARNVRPTKSMKRAAYDAYRQGNLLYQQGDIAGAIDAYHQGLRIDPLSVKLHFGLGVLYLKQKGNVFQAMHAFEEVVRLEPGHFTTLRCLAVLYQDKGFRHKAIEMWERALEVSPDPRMRERIKQRLHSLF